MRDPEQYVVTVTRRIHAPAAQIFDVLTDIRRHPTLDGSGTLRGEPRGPERLGPDSTFTMGMQVSRASYRTTNEVVEFEPDRRIAWATVGRWRGHLLFGGHRWRYALVPDEDATTVEHSFVWGYARPTPWALQLAGFPRRSGPAMEGSLARLEQIVTH